MSRRRREQLAQEQREAEERSMREADSLERSGENQYLYEHIRRDSLNRELRRARDVQREDSVAWRRALRERIDSLRRANSLKVIEAEQ